MKRKFFALLTLALLSVVLLFGCSDRKIEKITLKSNSFRTDYKVDAPMDLTGAYIQVYYGKDTVESVQITPDMVSGFDTFTTGTKTLTVTYKDFTVTHEYRVYNPENAAYDVKTTARLSSSIYVAADGSYTEYIIRLSIGDLKSISAASFTVKSQADTPLGIHDSKSNLTVTGEGSGSSCESMLYDGGKAIKMVIFNVVGGTLFDSDGILISLRINGAERQNIIITDITLSDGTGNYYLPSA